MIGPFLTEERLAFWQRLTAPFANIKTRKGSNGYSYQYITARQVMNRLDDVLGPENWEDKYHPGQNGVICELSITTPDGMVVTKRDAGAYGGTGDGGDDEKGGFSDAFKRAAVKFGIGRYLYNDGIPSWATVGAPQSEHQSQAAPAQQQLPQQNNGPRTANGGQVIGMNRVPVVIPGGKAVAYAWVKNIEEHYKVVLVPKIKDKASELGFGTTFNSWDQGQLNEIANIMVAYLKKLPNYDGAMDNLIFPAKAAPSAATDDDIPF